jgi:type I restriction enzyme M protein
MDARAATAVKPALEAAKKEPRGMTADHLQGIEKFEADLWKLADNLRANSNLASNEYFMPIMGLIFLRHATNRFYEAKAAIEADKAAGRMPDRPLVDSDFTRRRRAYLQQAAVELSAEGFGWVSERLQVAFDRHGKVPQDELDKLDWPEIP